MPFLLSCMNNVKEHHAYTNVASTKQARARELSCQSVWDNEGWFRVTGYSETLPTTWPVELWLKNSESDHVGLQINGGLKAYFCRVFLFLSVDVFQSGGTWQGNEI